jgi:hypothetical protein
VSARTLTNGAPVRERRRLASPWRRRSRRHRITGEQSAASARVSACHSRCAATWFPSRAAVALEAAERDHILDAVASDPALIGGRFAPRRHAHPRAGRDHGQAPAAARRDRQAAASARCIPTRGSRRRRAGGAGRTSFGQAAPSSARRTRWASTRAATAARLQPAGAQRVQRAGQRDSAVERRGGRRHGGNMEGAMPAIEGQPKGETAALRHPLGCLGLSESARFPKRGKWLR